MEEAAMQKDRKNIAGILALLMALIMTFTAAAAFGLSDVYAESDADRNAPDAEQAVSEEEPAVPQVSVATKDADLYIEWTYPGEAASYDLYRSYKTGSGWSLLKKDNKILRTKYDAYGKGLAKGVCDYLGIKW